MLQWQICAFPQWVTFTLCFTLCRLCQDDYGWTCCRPQNWKLNNVLQCWQKTDSRPQTICTENLVKFGCAVLEICLQTDTQTDKLITILHFPISVEWIFLVYHQQLTLSRPCSTPYRNWLQPSTSQSLAVKWWKFSPPKTPKIGTVAENCKQTLTLTLTGKYAETKSNQNLTLTLNHLHHFSKFLALAGGIFCCCRVVGTTK